MESESSEDSEEEPDPNPSIPARDETKGTGRRGWKKKWQEITFWRSQT